MLPKLGFLFGRDKKGRKMDVGGCRHVDKCSLVDFDQVIVVYLDIIEM